MKHVTLVFFFAFVLGCGGNSRISQANDRIYELESRDIVTQDDVIWALAPMTGEPLMVTDGRNDKDKKQKELWNEYWKVMERVAMLLTARNIELTKKVEINVVEIQMGNGK